MTEAIKPGDTVRLTWEGVATETFSDGNIYANGNRPRTWRSQGFTLEVVKRAPRQLPTEPGSAVMFENSQLLWLLGEDGVWGRTSGRKTGPQLLENYAKSPTFTVYRAVDE